MISKVYKKIISSKIYFALFFIILTLISSINVFHSGIMYSDDINFHMHRILAVVDNIRIGKYIPIYYNYLYGFGYGNGLFYPDIFLYIPGFFNFLGLDLIFSLKLFILIINFVSIYTMYLCVYKITGEKRYAFISAFLYSISNYRLIDFVSRGALGEMLAFMFLPLVVLGLYEIFFGNYKEGYYLTIGLSCLCFSHVISLYLMSFFTVLFIFINIKLLKEKMRFYFLLFYIFLSMLITVHFWLPMLEQVIEYSFNFSVNSRIFENIVPIYILFFDLPLNIFFEYYPIGVGFMYYFSFFKYFRFDHDRFFLSVLFLGFISTVFTSCSFIWKFDIFYKLFSVIQFPWRFYMFSSLFFIIGFTLMVKKYGFNVFFKICCIYFFIIFCTNSFMSFFNFYITKPLSDEIMMGEYLPKNFNMNVIYNYSDDSIEYNRYTRINNILNVNVKRCGEIELPLIFYKGYKACDDNTCYDIFKTNNGLVGVNVGSEVKSLSVFYSGTKIYNLTKYFSLFGIAIFVYKIKKCF